MKLWTDNVRKHITKHPSCIEAGECNPRHLHAAKDRRRWCKGRVNIPHTWEWLRRPDDIAREQRYGMLYNRVTEQAVCFGCGRQDFRFRHYCRVCFEPWPRMEHVSIGGTGPRRRLVIAPCERCGAPWTTPRRIGGAYVASGSVVR